jgi:nitrite reductase (NO-forming)
MNRSLKAIAAMAVSLAVLGACSSDGGSDTAYKQPTGPAVDTLKVQSGNVYFKPTKLDTKPGVVQIDLHNQESGVHDLVIKDIPGFQLEVSGEGANASGKVDLKANKQYEFYCTIPGHKEAGMRGTITVK